ncbi:hypothetical protein NMY22_g13171 [Coprinellus aureogranulatus]|nr:hypothetical protein NMY22_g13171 [Coprinellus aureogranulatus]
MLCARYLVASESVRRSGPVERAVLSVGYASEDEDDGIYYADEHEGSSVEEEVETMVIHDNPHTAGYQAGGAGYAHQQGYDQGEVLPSYTGHSRFVEVGKGGYGGAEVGPNGYILEKKTAHGYGQSPYYDGDAHAPEPVGTGTVNPTPPSGQPTSNVRDSMTVGNDNPVTTHVTGGSTRAAEKAPEITTTGQEEGYLPEEYVGARKGTEVAGGAGGEGELARDVD